MPNEKKYKKACKELDMIFVGIKKAYDRVSKSYIVSFEKRKWKKLFKLY